MAGTTRNLMDFTALNWNDALLNESTFGLAGMDEDQISLFNINNTSITEKDGAKISNSDPMSAPAEKTKVNIGDIATVTQAFYDDHENPEACANLASAIRANPVAFTRLLPSDTSNKPDLPYLYTIRQIVGFSSSSLPGFNRLNYSNGDFYWGQTKSVPLTQALFTYGKSFLPNQLSHALDFQQVPAGVGCRFFVQSNIAMIGQFNEKGQLNGKGVLLNEEGGILETTFTNGDAGGPRTKANKQGMPGTYYFKNGDIFKGQYSGGYGTCQEGSFTANDDSGVSGRFFMGILQKTPTPKYTQPASKSSKNSDIDNDVAKWCGPLDGSLNNTRIKPELTKFIPIKGKLYPRIESRVRADGAVSILGINDKQSDIIANVEAGRDAKLKPKLRDSAAFDTDMPSVTLGESAKKKK